MLSSDCDPGAQPVFDASHSHPARRAWRLRRKFASLATARGARRKVTAWSGMEEAGTGWGAEAQRARVEVKKLTGSGTPVQRPVRWHPRPARRQNLPNKTRARESQQPLQRVGSAPGRGEAGEQRQRLRAGAAAA